MPVFNQDPKIKSSVASWDDLPDRPFGEFVTECGETLAWDGTPTATAVSIGDITYYRVSESTPTIEELTGGSMNSVLGENTYPVSLKAEDFEQRNEHVIFCNVWDGTPFIVVNEDDAVAEMNGETLTFAKKGIYFILTSYGVYVKDLTVTGYNFTKIEIKKIDKAYLPKSIYGASGTVTLTSSNWAEGKYTLTVEDLGEKDAIFFTPSTKNDKTALEEANIFMSTNGQIVTFEAETTPTDDITLDYFIVRGA